MLWRAILLIIITMLITPHHAFAHLPGQPPFFKINGEFTTIYPVQASPYTKAFTFLQDVPVEDYVVGEELAFELDEKFLPFPSEYLPHLTFLWDFGDGTKAEGLKNLHTYSKPGSYEMIVQTQTDEVFSEPQLLQSTLITVLPNKQYVAPKPIITVNGKEAKGYPLGFVETNFQDEITLSVKFAKNPSAKIVQYLWDMDDGVTGEGETLIYHYQEDRSFVTPILRVIDSNGIMTDVSETIVNKTANAQQKNNSQPFLTGSILLGGLLILLAIFRSWRKKKPS